MDPPGSSSSSSGGGSNNNGSNHGGDGNNNNDMNNHETRDNRDFDDVDDDDVEDNGLDEELLEQLRSMAMIEANFRVQEITGFVREEYDRQQRENPSLRSRPRPMHFFYNPFPTPQPILPDPPRMQSFPPPPAAAAALPFMMQDMSLNSSGTSSAARSSTSSAVCAQEASLPPRRANRRYNEHPRSTAVTELSDGVVVQLPDGTIVDETILEESEEEVKREEEDGHSLSLRPLLDQRSTRTRQETTRITTSPDSQHIIVKCLGCGCRLKVHRLATLVNCSRCLTVSPSLLLDDEKRT